MFIAFDIIYLQLMDVICWYAVAFVCRLSRCDALVNYKLALKHYRQKQDALF